MNFWTGLHFFCFIVYVAGFFYITIKNPYAVANWVLAVLFFYFALWSLCNSILYNTNTTLTSADMAIKVQSVAWASFITCYFLFILFFTDNKKLLGLPFTYIILISVPAVFIYQTFNGQMLECCRQVSYGMTATWKNTPWTYAYYAYYTAMFFGGMYILSGYRNRAKTGTDKRMADILLLSAAAVFVFGTAVSVIMKQTGIYLPLDANVAFLIFAAGLIYCAEKFGSLSLTNTKTADSIMRTINEGIVLLGARGEFLSANGAALEIFGYDTPGFFPDARIEEALGRPAPRREGRK